MAPPTTEGTEVPREPLTTTYYALFPSILGQQAPWAGHLHEILFRSLALRFEALIAGPCALAVRTVLGPSEPEPPVIWLPC